MASYPASFSLRSSGKGTYEITRQVAEVVCTTAMGLGVWGKGSPKITSTTPRRVEASITG